MWGAIGNMGNAAMQTGLNVSRMKTGTMSNDGLEVDINSQSYKDWEAQGGKDSGYSYNDWAALNYQNNKQP